MSKTAERDAKSAANALSEDMSDARDAAARTADDAATDLAAHVDRLTRDLAALTQALGSVADQKAHAAAHRAEAAGTAVAQGAARQITAAQDAAEGFGQQVDAYARRNPAQALGFAAAAGFLAAMMITRRS